MTIWVVAADASRARIFQTERANGRLAEAEDLVHPASRLKEQGLVSDRAGRGRGRPTGGGVGHTVGHEHDAEDVERDRFAKALADALAEGRKAHRFERVHIIAPPRFLGMLRKHMDPDTRSMVASETDANVTGERPEAIRVRLPDSL